MYNSPYQFNTQPNLDRINAQINELEKMKQQMQQPSINQTFQLAPTNNHTIRYANTIDDVYKEQIFYDTPFFSKDMSILWLKSAKGDIKTYELNELIPKDSKDFEIEFLKEQIEELKGKIENVSNDTNVITKQDTTNTTKYNEPDGDEFEDEKSTGISKISRGKKK